MSNLYHTDWDGTVISLNNPYECIVLPPHCLYCSLYNSLLLFLCSTLQDPSQIKPLFFSSALYINTPLDGASAAAWDTLVLRRMSRQTQSAFLTFSLSSRSPTLPPLTPSLCLPRTASSGAFYLSARSVFLFFTPAFIFCLCHCNRRHLFPWRLFGKSNCWTKTNTKKLTVLIFLTEQETHPPCLFEPCFTVGFCWRNNTWQAGGQGFWIAL